MTRRSTVPGIAMSTLALVLALLAAFSTAPGTAASAQTGPAITVTFLQCPPGGDESGPPPGCANTRDAPELALLSLASDVAIPLSDLERTADGAYAVPWSVLDDAGWSGGEIGLINFFPRDLNFFTFDGVDTLGRWYAGVRPVDGQTRDVTVSYWNGPDGLITPPENTLVVNAYTCGRGIDPSIDPSGCAPATGDLTGLYIGTPPLRDLQLDDFRTRDGGTLTYDGLPAYTQAQVVVQQPIPGYGEAFITGQAETIADGTATAYLLRNERRVVDVYFYAPDGSATSNPTSTPAPGTGTGTLRLMLVGCPPGVTPHDDPGRCAEPVDAPSSATVGFPESGERIALSRFDRDESDAYLITGVQSSVTVTGVTSPDHDRIASDADRIEGAEVVYIVDPGETRDGRLYYFNEG